MKFWTQLDDKFLFISLDTCREDISVVNEVGGEVGKFLERKDCEWIVFKSYFDVFVAENIFLKPCSTTEATSS